MTRVVRQFLFSAWLGEASSAGTCSRLGDAAAGCQREKVRKKVCNERETDKKEL